MKKVLVIGATGKQAQGLFAALHNNNNFNLLALTRDRSSPKAKALAGSGNNITLVQADLDDTTTIEQVFKGQSESGSPIWGVFCVLNYPGLGAPVEGEILQGKVVADLSLTYGVKCFIYSSAAVRGGSPDAVFEGHASKIAIEEYIKQLGEKNGFPWTVIRPGFFMENWSQAYIGKLSVSVFKAGLPETTALQLVAGEDNGQVAAGVFQDPAPYLHKALVVTGETLTMKQQDEVYQRVTGNALPALPRIVAQGVIYMNAGVKALLAEMTETHEDRAAGKIPDLEEQKALAKRAYPHIQTFAQWVESSVKSQKDVQNDRNWNRISLWALVTGQS